jgi:hypothetical protein
MKEDRARFPWFSASIGILAVIAVALLVSESVGLLEGNFFFQLVECARLAQLG